MTEMDEILTYGRQGFTCAQMVVQTFLDLQGKENPELIRSMSGFAGGMGWTGDTCGVLVGAVAVLGLYAGKGSEEIENEPELMFMIEDTLKWFLEQNGSNRCVTILEGRNGTFNVQHCGEIIRSTIQFLKEILVENGFDLAGSENDF
mgnify:CR=1 FL=1|jgi:C_GCAxxG_C_C family probable redox protein